MYVSFNGNNCAFSIVEGHICSSVYPEDATHATVNSAERLAAILQTEHLRKVLMSPPEQVTQEDIHAAIEEIYEMGRTNMRQLEDIFGDREVHAFHSQGHMTAQKTKQGVNVPFMGAVIQVKYKPGVPQTDMKPKVKVISKPRAFIIERNLVTDPNVEAISKNYDSVREEGNVVTYYNSSDDVVNMMYRTH